MSKSSTIMRKMFVAKPRLTAAAIAFTAAAGFAVASTGSAYATGQVCGNGTSGLSSICIHIDGGGNVVDDAIGSATVTSSNGIGEYAANGNWVTYSGHVQVINPKGTTLCNSVTKTLTHGTAMSCESPNQGATYTGEYCTILWVYNGEYHNYGEECLNVTD